MDKETIRFVDIETKIHELHRCKKSYILEDVDIDKVLVSNKISSYEKTVNTLLVTCLMIIKLTHYM